MAPRKIKLLVLGESNVGKTSLISRFVDNKFTDTIATVGTDLRDATVKVDGVHYKVEVWDTAGTERFRSMTHNVYRNAQGAILVYDVTNSNSLDKLEFWLNDLRDKTDNPNIVFMVVGNKIDEMRAISQKEGQSFANKHGGLFMETSGKCDQFVDDAFNDVINEIVRSNYFVSSNVSQTLIIQNNVNIHVEVNKNNRHEDKTSILDNNSVGGGGCC